MRGKAMHHIDGDTSNNDPSNIRIVNMRDNLQHQPLNTLSVHDLSKLRQIIAEVIADGWQCGKGCELRHPWSFNSADIDLDDLDYEQRKQQFIEAIITRIITTAAPSLREETGK